ncbi:MAG: hypothetical protein ACR2N4_17385 [Jatrophihabitans sp.]
MLVAAPSSGLAAIDSALISAVVALAIALFTHLSVISRDRNARRYDRRRAALLDAQVAALELRQRLREYGSRSRELAGQPSPALAEVERHFDESHSALDVALSRIDDQRVRAAIDDWRVAAQARFVSVYDVSASQEQSSWQEMNAAIGRALQSKSGSTPK